MQHYDEILGVWHRSATQVRQEQLIFSRKENYKQLSLLEADISFFSQ